MSKVSIIIPSRNETYLQKTLDDILKKATGEIEILPVIDGPSKHPITPSKPDPRVKPIFNKIPQGMRPSENTAAQFATGRYLMKCDAHCIFKEGFDETLKSCCDEDHLVVPTRHSIDPETWRIKGRNFNYHYMTFPYDLSMYGYGLHAKTYEWHENKRINEEKKDKRVDDLMTFQGSCWFTQRDAFFRLLYPLDHANYYFYQEAQEVGLKFWMSGGKCLVNKDTWYGHLHKGATHGRGFYLSLHGKRNSETYSADYWLNDRFPLATRKWKWYIEHFWPVLGWPEDWEDPKYKEDFLKKIAAEEKEKTK